MILGWQVEDDAFSISLRASDPRFSAHPSGCRDPQLELVQSVFLLGPDDETVLPSSAYLEGEATKLVFELDGRSPETWAAVLFPTLSFDDKSGERRTTIFGIVGFYELA